MKERERERERAKQRGPKGRERQRGRVERILMEERDGRKRKESLEESKEEGGGRTMFVRLLSSSLLAVHLA